jgi:dTDP-4-amino-4,6-dideoxygalactose transaminase
MIPIAKPYLNKEEAQAAYDTVLSGWVTQGPRVQEFEQKFADYTGAQYAIAVSSCTTGLHLAMIVAGIKEGDEVICPSMSYIATANSITYTGAKAVFAEVDPKTYNISPQHAESLINEKTKAILVVHQIGMPADLDAFHKLGKKYNIKIIEDAACAIGSRYKGNPLGSHSELVCFSFHPRKVITTGDGGMVTTNNEAYYQRLKLLRQHGMSISDQQRHQAGKALFEEHIEIGYNYRMTDIQASVGVHQMNRLDDIIEQRRKIAMKYHEGLKGIPHIRLPVEEEGYFSNYQSYSIFLHDDCPVSRDDLIQQMREKGIATKRGIMTAHREPAYAGQCKGISLPQTEKAADQSMLIPLFAQMTNSQINHVIDTLHELLKVKG